MHTRTVLFLTLTILLIFLSISSATELDELLSGFDTETQKSAPPQELEQLLDGFDDSSELTTSRSSEKRVLPDWLDIHGSAGLQTNANFAHDAPDGGETDYRGLSMLKVKGELTGDLTFSSWKARVAARGFYDGAYAIQGRSNYTDELLDQYEKELEPTEVWLQSSLTDSIDIKTGRQIIVWGRSDNIRITDILNPLDLRQPGLVDIRDLRLPVTMTKLDSFFGQWNLGAVVIHEPRFNKSPVYNSDFFPGNTPAPTTTEPSVSFDNQQYGMVLNGIFSGWDISFYGASVFDSIPHVELNHAAQPVLEYARVYMAGLATNLVFGNWLFKAETAHWEGLEYSNVPERDFSRSDFLIGLEYSGLSETLISFECSDRHINDFDTRLETTPDGQQQDLSQLTIRVNRDFSHDTLHLTLLLSSYGLKGEDGAFQRYQLEHDISDEVAVTGGIVFYQSGDYPPFSAIGDNDRVFLKIEYRF